MVKKELITNLHSLPIKNVLYSNPDSAILRLHFAFIDSVNLYAITYLSDGLKVHGYIASPKQEGEYPAIIFNRGGNRDFGVINIGMAAMAFGQIAKDGYVVIASQYRGNAGGEGKEEFGGDDVNDVIRLIDVLDGLDNVDKDKIGMFGMSRGGLMTLSALCKTDRIKAAAMTGGLSDTKHFAEDRPEMDTDVLAEMIPNYEENKEAELEKRSPVQWVDKMPKNVPILLMHGTCDWRVKPSQSLRLALEFDKYRIPYRLIMYEGSDHGINEHSDEWRGELMSWFDRYLKNNEALPNMEFHGK